MPLPAPANGCQGVIMRESGPVLASTGGAALSAAHRRLRRAGTSCADAGAAILGRIGCRAQLPPAQALPAVCADADGSGLANPYRNPGHSLEAGVDWFCLALLNNAMVGGVAAVLERQARQQGARAETCRE